MLNSYVIIKITFISCFIGTTVCLKCKIKRNVYKMSEYKLNTKSNFFEIFEFVYIFSKLIEVSLNTLYWKQENIEQS